MALQEIPQAPRWTSADNVEQGCDLLRDGEVPPELILLAQPLPGCYQQADIDRLQRLAPLARIVLVAGTWCEGELRTGVLPTGILRLYWYELARWWSAALDRLATGRYPPWSTPLDAAARWRLHGDARPPAAPEGYAANSAGTAAEARRTQTLAIATVDYAAFTAYSSALAHLDWSATWIRPGRCWKRKPEFAAGLWDGSQLSTAELATLTEFCQHLGECGGRVTVLLDFPRVEHLPRARAAGAATVLAKPFIAEEVACTLAGL